MILGNLTTAVYVIYCINNSKNDIKKFFLGFGLRISIFKLDSNLPLSANGKIAYGKLREYLREKNQT